MVILIGVIIVLVGIALLAAGGAVTWKSFAMAIRPKDVLDFAFMMMFIAFGLFGIAVGILACYVGGAAATGHLSEVNRLLNSV